MWNFNFLVRIARGISGQWGPARRERVCLQGAFYLQGPDCCVIAAEFTIVSMSGLELGVIRKSAAVGLYGQNR